MGWRSASHPLCSKTLAARLAQYAIASALPCDGRGMLDPADVVGAVSRTTERGSLCTRFWRELRLPAMGTGVRNCVRCVRACLSGGINLSGSEQGIVGE